MDLPERADARLIIYDILGRAVRVLVNREVLRGRVAVSWDGRDRNGARVGNGMYFARLSAARGTRLVKVPLIR